MFGDVFAPPNQREAAMRLLLLGYEKDPPKPLDPDRAFAMCEKLEQLPADTLRRVLVDPKSPRDGKAAAWMILVERGMLKPPMRSDRWD